MATYNIATGTVDPKKLKAGDIINCPYSGSAKSIALPEGTYILEVWGARGGYRSDVTYAGKGGYAKGTLTLTAKSTTLYLLAGGAGGNSTSNTGNVVAGGFNGGGYRYGYPGGGGASDVRIGSNSYLARVIVAGGGGSGFVLTSSTIGNVPSGYLLNSSYYLTNTSLIAGNAAIVLPSGSSATGVSDNGYVRITIIDIKSGDIFVKVNGVWVPAGGTLAKVNGVWVPAGGTLAKVNGVWVGQ